MASTGNVGQTVDDPLFDQRHRHRPGDCHGPGLDLSECKFPPTTQPNHPRIHIAVYLASLA